MVRAALAGLVAAGALLAGAAPALADTAALSVTASDGSVDPVAYIPRVITVSGTATASTRLFVKHRAAGGAPCAPSAFTDSGTFVDGSFYNVPVSGPFSFQQILTWRTPGTWMVCFWLANTETSLATPISQAITVRTPAGSIGASVLPNPPRAGDLAQVTVAGVSEAPRRVYAKLRPADGTACAPTFDLDPGGGMIAGWSVDGPFSIKANINNPTFGQYMVCMWLAGDSDDTLPVAGPVAQAFSVVRARPIVVSSTTLLNCRSKSKLQKVAARKVKSVCLRYKFSSAPLAGERLSVTYLTPSRRTYKTVKLTSRGGTSQTLATAALPVRAYSHRKGLWRVLLQIDNHQVSNRVFRVT
jgi:hypothetical protein